MKRILIAALFFAIALGCVSAQETIYRDTAVALWNAPTEPVLLTGEDWEYDVYLADRALGDPAALTLDVMTYIGRAAEETLTIDMTVLPRVEYWLVVRAVFVDANGDETLGERGDSLNNADPTMAPAGWYYVPEQGVLGGPSNLRDSGM